MGFRESGEVRGWTDSHTLRQGLFHIAAFTAVIREGSLLSSRTCVKWQLEQTVPLGLWYTGTGNISSGKWLLQSFMPACSVKTSCCWRGNETIKVWPPYCGRQVLKARWNVARLLPESRSPLVWLTALTLCFPEVLKEIQSTLEGGRGWVSTNCCC